MTEIEYRDVPNYPRYIVFAHGVIYSLQRKEPRPLKPVENRSTGYYQVSLTNSLGRKMISVHRIVCEAFHGESPEGMSIVRHLDGCKWNPAASNLCWGTHSRNMLDKHVHGTMSQAKLTKDKVREIRQLYSRRGYYNLRRLAEMYDVTVATISNIINWRTWRHLEL